MALLGCESCLRLNGETNSKLARESPKDRLSCCKEGCRSLSSRIESTEPEYLSPEYSFVLFRSFKIKEMGPGQVVRSH